MSAAVVSRLFASWKVPARAGADSDSIAVGTSRRRKISYPDRCSSWIRRLGKDAAG